jgi:tetratricopeptide (TPR) repeat protein
MTLVTDTSSMGVEWSRRRRRTARCLVLGFLVSAVAFAADPFYENLLIKGTDQYARGDYAGAARSLRIACFGFLDEPTLLANGLTRLGLAQAATGDAEGFRETFRRIEEVEARFKAYSQAQIPPDVHAAFEAVVVRMVPEAILAADPSFSRLVPKPEDRIAKLPARQQRRELERLIEKEPTKTVWFVMLATLDDREGETRDMLKHANAALRLEPDNSAALRLRGLAEAQTRDWEGACRDLAASGASTTDSRVAAALLHALVEMHRFKDADAVVVALPPSVARDDQVRNQAARALEGERAAAAAEKIASPTPEIQGNVVSSGVAAKGAAGQERADAGHAGAPVPAVTPTPTIAPMPTVAPTPRIVPTPTAVSTPTAVPEPKANPPSSLTAPPPHEAPAPTATPTAAVEPAVPPVPTPEQHAPVPTEPAASTVLSRDAQAEISRARALADEGRRAEAFALARQVADANPQSRQAQHVAAEMAYRGALWEEALRYFHRGGDPNDSEPRLLFYLAVTQYETGDRHAAAATLARCISKIEHTAYVKEYEKKINAGVPPGR